jgi:6-pyruvoyltetrahydropterin/6-carboxytetrahydropterin synthase
LCSDVQAGILNPILNNGGVMKLVFRTHFDAAHKLPHYNGPCSRLHGHRWAVDVEIEGTVDPISGMLIDFKDLKRILNAALPDHQYLNEFVPEVATPTAENMAINFFPKIQAALPPGIYLRALTIWESEDAGARVEG